jgi:hypothetical protein
LPTKQLSHFLSLKKEKSSEKRPVRMLRITCGI